VSVHQIPPETDEGEDEFEERGNAVLRRELGLRPIGHPDDGDHRDQRPCSSWYLSAEEDEYKHEVDCHHPLGGCTHANQPSVVASMYPEGSSRVRVPVDPHCDARAAARATRAGRTRPHCGVPPVRRHEQKYEDVFLRFHRHPVHANLSSRSNF